MVTYIIAVAMGTLSLCIISKLIVVQLQVYELKPPFIKCEDMSGRYKPLVIQGMPWPMTMEDYISTYFGK